MYTVYSIDMFYLFTFSINIFVKMYINIYFINIQVKGFGLNYHNCLMFFKSYPYTHQGCIYFIKSTVYVLRL